MVANPLAATDLISGYHRSELRLADTSHRYAIEREKLSQRLMKAGLRGNDLDVLFEAHEREFDPDFGDAQSRRADNSAARRLYDFAQRAGVSGSEWQAFIATLKDERLAQAQSTAYARALYAAGGSSLLEDTRHDVDALIGLRQDVLTLARRMNPNLDVRTGLALTDDPDTSGRARFDPLRRLVELSFDASRFDLTGAKRDAYLSLWSSVEHLLSDKEKAVLDEEIGPNADLMKPGDRTRARAEAFARFVAPDRDKPKGMMQAFKPVFTFFARISNAAKGRGFQTAADVWKRAADGKLADRDGDDVVRPPRERENPEAYARMKGAMKELSDIKLGEAILRQKRQLDADRKHQKSLFTKIVHYSAPARAASRALNYFSVIDGDALKADSAKLRELSRGLGMLEAERRRRAQQRVSSIGANGPPGRGSPEGPNRQGPGADNVLPFEGRPFQPHAAISASLVDQLSGGDKRPAPDATATFDGRNGQYGISPAGPQAEALGMAWRVGLQGGPQLGMARDVQSAAILIDAYERVAGQGPPSRPAMMMAAAANQAGQEGNADIRAIRASGLLDERLDAAITQRDVMAFAYPLKTGDVIFQGPDGRWRASTAEEFGRLAALTQDQHLMAAADVINSNVVPIDTRRDRDRLGQAAQQPATAPASVPLSVPPSEEGRAKQAGAEWNIDAGRFEASGTAVDKTKNWQDLGAATRVEAERRETVHAAETGPLPEVARSSIQPTATTGATADVQEDARLAARVLVAGPLRVDPARQAEAAKEIRKLPTPELRRVYDQTTAALEEVKARFTAGQPKAGDKVAKLEFTMASNALEKELMARGEHVTQIGGPGPDKPRGRGKGQER